MTACARCQTALEPSDLRCAVCALPVERGLSPSAPRVEILRCQACGAAAEYCATARAPRCGFCGAVAELEQPADPIEVAELRIAMTVERAVAEAALRGWLADRGWLAPSALADDAAFESLTPVGWAAWRVDADALVTWAADSDEGARRAAWAPHAGEDQLAFRELLIPATRGLRAEEARRLLPYYVLADAIPIARPLAAGEVATTVEQFDAQRSAARRQIRDRVAAAARVRVQRRIPGTRHRNVRVACLIERQVTARISLPAWVLAYRYRGRPYRAIVHGQRAEIVVGEAPIDWAKLARVAAVVVAVAVIAVVVMWLAGGRPPR